jgi:hypothetical protein
MYSYLLYSGSYENSDTAVLYHATRFNESQLSAMFRQCLIEAGKIEYEKMVDLFEAALKSEQSDGYEVRQDDYEWAKERGVRVEDVFYAATDLMISNHGFSRQVYEAKCQEFGAWDTCYPEQVSFHGDPWA